MMIRFQKIDCVVGRNVEQDVDGHVKEEDFDKDIDLIPSNQSSDQH